MSSKTASRHEPPVDDGVFMREPVVVRVYDGIAVVRDDLLPGGTKVRFLPYVMGDPRKEVVYASPFCGGAQVALAVAGKHRRQRVNIFTAQRKAENMHERQHMGLGFGARYTFVKMGYFTNVVAKARDYAAEAPDDRYLLPTGFATGDAITRFSEAVRRLRKTVKQVDQIWCVASSGMLAKSLALGYPEAEVHAVKVGLRTSKEQVELPENVILHDFADDLDTICKEHAPFPCCPNYDRKAWVRCLKMHKGRTLFWNVMG